MSTGLGVVVRQHSRVLLAVRRAYKGIVFSHLDYDGGYPLVSGC